MTCDFSLKHYAEILTSFKEAGYTFYRFDEVDKTGDKAIFMRHDIEANIDAAVDMALVEAKLGIKSTFFVRLHATFYNPLSQRFREKIFLISKMGHEIGIHYEPSAFQGLGKKEFELKFKMEKMVMEFNYGNMINSLSTHEPRDETYKMTDELSESVGIKYNAYSNRFLKDMKYLSDSAIIPLTKGRWREGCLCKIPKAWKKPNKLHILTHPIIWYRTNNLQNY